MSRADGNRLCLPDRCLCQAPASLYLPSKRQSVSVAPMQFAFKVRSEQPCLWLADGQELVHTQQLNQLPLPGRPTGHKGPSCFKEILFMGSPSLTINEAFGPKNEALGPKRRELDPKKRGNNLTLPGVTAPPAAAKRRRKSLAHCMPHLTQGKDHRP